jgi:uncharacterized membrane protein
VRLIGTDPSYSRMVNRAFDKIRQSSRGMPAVIIRLLDALTSVASDVTSPEQLRVLTRQAGMILRSAEESVPEESDRDDIRIRYRRLMALQESPDGAEG